MGINMGLHPLMRKGGDKRNFRWMFSIFPYVGEQVHMLPPSKAARPNITFKEYNAEHLHETIYFPGKVDWQSAELTVYDIKCNDSPLYEWMKKIYNPDPTSNGGKGFYGPSLSETLGGDQYKTTMQVYMYDVYGPSLSETLGGDQYKTTMQVYMYDGCGNVIEQWIYMNAYASKIDWGTLDMQSSELTTADLTIRYDRAYIVKTTPYQKAAGGGGPFRVV